MSDKRLGIKQRALLLTLMATARSLTSKDIKELAGFEMPTGKALDGIYEAKLMETDKTVKPYVHTLTDNGWAWCEKELSAGAGARDGSAGGALYIVLAGLARHLSRRNFRLADVFVAVEAEAEAPDEDEPQDAEAAIRAAYRQLRDEPRGFVSLTSLRPMLAGLSKQEVDDTLRRMNNTKGVNVIPQSNQKILTAQDRAAMIRVGNEDRLLISIDEP
jgi:hypothetical protein